MLLATVLAATGPGQTVGAQPVDAVHFDFRHGLSSLEDIDHRLTLHEEDRAGGALEEVKRGSDWALRFPPVCDLPPRTCPRAILASGPADFLNPGERTVMWGASIQMMPNETSDGGNILQKGLSMTGTQYKLQVDGLQGRPSCVVAGRGAQYMARSRSDIADGHWHELTCVRKKALLTLIVDGQRKSDVVVPSRLSISNDSPLRLGGKGHGPYNDQFHGSIDDAFVEIG